MVNPPENVQTSHSETAPAIEIRRLTKTFDDGTRALCELDLTVQRGEIYCLLGANGAGKSTTINILLNFIPPSSGHAAIQGIDVTREALKARRHVSYLSERVALYDGLTARQNLLFFARIAGLSPAGARLEEVLAEVGLPARLLPVTARALSKGQRQRLAFASCLIRDTPVLLLDEPLSGLDPKAAAEFVTILQRLRDRKRAILLSTHDVFRTMTLADRIGIMRGGRLAFEGSCDNIRNTSLERIYLDVMGTEESRPAAGDPLLSGLNTIIGGGLPPHA